MITNLTLDSASWSVERNGKMHFKQEQLFHLHRLSLMPESVTLQANIPGKAPSALTGATVWPKGGCECLERAV